MSLAESLKKGVVEQLSQRVEQLIALHSKSAELNEELQTALTAEREQRKLLQQRVSELEQELTLTQLTTAMVMEEDAKAAESKRTRSFINQLLREIDECIALVSTPVTKK